MEDILMSNDDQNSEILVLLRNLSADMQDVKLRLATQENHLVNFATRLLSLEEKVDQKLYDTRPIWQNVLEQLKSVEATLGFVKSDVATLKNDVTTLRDNDALKSNDLATLKNNQERVEKELKLFHSEAISRLDKLEDQKYFVDFINLKVARMQLEINELKGDVLALQAK